jgi:hypothetical protein
MEAPKKKKHQSLAELKTGGIILLLFSPCIICAFYGAGTFVINNIYNPSGYYSTGEVGLLAVGFLALTFFAFLVIIRITLIVQRIVGLMREYWRLQNELDETINS